MKTPIMDEEDKVTEVLEAMNRSLDHTKAHLQMIQEMTSALMLIAAGPRPDGTFNRCREACASLATETLRRVAGIMEEQLKGGEE